MSSAANASPSTSVAYFVRSPNSMRIAMRNTHQSSKDVRPSGLQRRAPLGSDALTPSRAEQPVLRDAPERADTVFPADLLPLGVRAAGIRDSDLINAGAPLRPLASRQRRAGDLRH